MAKQGVRLKKKNEIAQLQSAETNVKGRKIRRNKKNGSSRTSGSSSSIGSSSSKRSVQQKVYCHIRKEDLRAREGAGFY